MNHVRHSNIYSVPPYFKVGLVGAGGLGATTALTLAKMGVCEMTVWDDDIVNDANIPTQLHPVCEIGNPKIVSLKQTLEMFSDEIVFDGYCSRVTADTTLSGKYHLFISAVDSITARKEIWGVVANTQVDWYCDMRMAAEEFQMYLVDMQDFQAIERYHEQLMRLNEDDIQELPCTAKATFHCSMAAAGHVGKILRDIVRGEATSYRLIHYIVDERIVTVNL